MSRSFWTPSFKPNLFQRYWIVAAALLLVLFLGDVSTTVVFTEVGLPESNPLLAPIAGSFIQQVLFKAPFAALLLIIGYYTGAVSERMAPGAGVFPAMVLVMMYSAPVVHNYVSLFA